MSGLFVPGREQPRLERGRSSIGTDGPGWLTPGRTRGVVELHLVVPDEGVGIVVEAVLLRGDIPAKVEHPQLVRGLGSGARGRGGEGGGGCWGWPVIRRERAKISFVISLGKRRNFAKI